MKKEKGDKGEKLDPKKYVIDFATRDANGLIIMDENLRTAMLNANWNADKENFIPVRKWKRPNETQKD
jgi:hypothetical protein